MNKEQKKFFGLVNETLTYQEAKDLYRMFSQRMIKEDLEQDVMLKIADDIRGLGRYILRIIDSSIGRLRVKRADAKMRKEVLGYDMGWDYSYSASQVHYMMNIRRYWIKKCANSK